MDRVALFFDSRCRTVYCRNVTAWPFIVNSCLNPIWLTPLWRLSTWRRVDNYYYKIITTTFSFRLTSLLFQSRFRTETVGKTRAGFHRLDALPVIQQPTVSRQFYKLLLLLLLSEAVLFYYQSVSKIGLPSTTSILIN